MSKKLKFEENTIFPQNLTFNVINYENFSIFN